jgi:hypothetical protein
MIRVNDKKKSNNNPSLAATTTIFTLAIIIAMSTIAAPAVASATAATTTTMPQPVTATTDNQSVNVLISWEPTEIEPGQDTEFTLDFQDPSSGDSIPHVNYNFETIDQNNGETVQSMTDLHTHSGSDEQTVTFDTTGSFNFVVTIIGTGIDPPFDTTQSGTAQTVITVGQQLAGAIDGNNTAAGTTDSTTTAAPTEAATATSSNAVTTTTNTSSGIELSPQPVLQERTTTTSQTPINQTHISATFTGNGTLTLPDTTETINFTTNGTALISLMTHSTQAKETLMTEQGETATATFYEILKINPATAGEGKGLTMAVIHTDSTGTIAPLNGTIVAGISDLQSNEENTVTLWEWESGIDNNSGVAPPMQGESTMNTTTSELPPPINMP